LLDKGLGGDWLRGLFVLRFIFRGEKLEGFSRNIFSTVFCSFFGAKKEDWAEYCEARKGPPTVRFPGKKKNRGWGENGGRGGEKVYPREPAKGTKNHLFYVGCQ